MNTRSQYIMLHIVLLVGVVHFYRCSRGGESLKSSEIAKLAGVSRSTVSRVINNYANVPEETRRRVMEIIEKYDYEPNTSARSLAGKPHNMIGLFVIIPLQQDYEHRVYESGFFGLFMQAVIDTLNTRGYFATVNLVYSKKDYETIRQAFRQRRIDGGIFIGTDDDITVLSEVLKKGYPMAIMDLDPAEARSIRGSQANLTIMNWMDYEGACEVLEHLIGLGHAEIGILVGRLSTYSGRERLKAYYDVMRRHGLPVREEFVLKCHFSRALATQEVSRMVESGVMPTALFSCNDEMAMSALDVFQNHGIRVPQDISLVGFDDIALATMTRPALTTVKVPIIELAKKAAESVIQAVEKGDGSQVIYNYPTKLIIRDSCAVAPVEEQEQIS